MELHVVHYKEEYETLDLALRRPNGVTIIVYFCKVTYSYTYMLTFLDVKCFLYSQLEKKKKKEIKIHRIPIERSNERKCDDSQLQNEPNEFMEGIVKNLTVIRTAHSSVRIIPANLTGILKPFSTDYFLYWGSITTPINIHNILWIICREPIGLTTRQVNPYPLFLFFNVISFNRAFLFVARLQSFAL